MAKRLGQGIGNDPLITGQIYHIYNRTISAEVPFFENNYLELFIKLLFHYKTYNTAFSQHKDKLKRLNGDDLSLRLISPNIRNVTNCPDVRKYVPVEIYAYCPMPNHYHLLVKQLIDGGISHFIKSFQSSITQIYNKKDNRKGTLWESKFKAKLVDSDESFLQVNRYIHLNAVESSKISIKKPEEYIWSSYLDAIGQRHGKLCNHEILWNLMKPNIYRGFVNSKVDDSQFVEYFIENI